MCSAPVDCEDVIAQSDLGGSVITRNITYHGFGASAMKETAFGSDDTVDVPVYKNSQCSM